MAKDGKLKCGRQRAIEESPGTGATRALLYRWSGERRRVSRSSRFPVGDMAVTRNVASSP